MLTPEEKCYFNYIFLLQLSTTFLWNEEEEGDMRERISRDSVTYINGCFDIKKLLDFNATCVD